MLTTLVFVYKYVLSFFFFLMETVQCGIKVTIIIFIIYVLNLYCPLCLKSA